MFDPTLITGFDWDSHNQTKNQDKHGISKREIEEVFLDEKLITLFDEKHSQIEQRHQAIGQTFDGLVLFVVFTYRGYKLRAISARKANKKERNIYENF